MPYRGFPQTNPQNTAELIESLLGAYMILLIISFVVTAYCILITAKIYQKAGRPGWAAVIPFYNQYVEFDIATDNGLLFLLTFVPLVGVVASYYCIFKLSKRFGKSDLFCVLSIFFPLITRTILAFGDSQYDDQGMYYHF